jgi:hypothetical protein
MFLYLVYDYTFDFSPAAAKIDHAQKARALARWLAAAHGWAGRCKDQPQQL